MDAMPRFLERYPDPIEAVAIESAIASGTEDAAATAGPPTRLRCLVGSAVSSLSRLRLGVGARPPGAGAAVRTGSQGSGS